MVLLFWITVVTFFTSSSIILSADTNTQKCPVGLSYKDKLCYCGEAGLSVEEAAQWECIDNSHYLCLRKSGCLKSGILMPTWSYYGDRSKSFDRNIPKMPGNPKGYALEYTPQGHVWACYNEDGCMCGSEKINGNEYYHERCFVKKSETREGDLKNIIRPLKREHYYIYRNVIRSYHYVNTVCSALPDLCNAIIATAAYRLGVKTEDIIDQFPEYKEAIQHLASDNICGNVDMNTLKRNSGYICENESLICNSKKGCVCGDHRVVYKAECKNNIQYCQRVRADWIQDDAITQYQCITQVVCAKDKCKCGDNTCTMGASCIDGQCICQDKTNSEEICNLRKEIEYYDIDLCECQEGDTDSGCNCTEEDMDDPDMNCGKKCDIYETKGASLEKPSYRIANLLLYYNENNELASYCENCDNCDGFRYEYTDYQTDDPDRRGDSSYEPDCTNINGKRDNDYSWYSDIGTVNNIKWKAKPNSKPSSESMFILEKKDDTPDMEFVDFYPDNKEFRKATCMYNDLPISIFYHLDFERHGVHYLSDYDIDTFDPCKECSENDEPSEVLNSLISSRMSTESILSRLYCNIRQPYDLQDNSVSGELHSSWEDIRDAYRIDYRHCSVKQLPPKPHNQYSVEINYRYKTCTCGKQKMTYEDANSYSCELGLAWRCLDDNCPCGDIQCKKDQICLIPGICK